MAYERRALYPLPFAQQAIARARALGKRVIFVSDMYLPKAFCEEMLRSNGFDDFDALYVSSDCGLLKNTGSLYRHVLAELQLPGERILHVGDNPRPMANARPNTVCTPTPSKKPSICSSAFPKTRGSPSAKSPGANARESLFLGLSARGCLREDFVADPFWYRIGYQIAGPLIYGYVRFIIGQTRGRGLAKIFFLSRDGYILRRVYERLTADQPDCPPAGYLYASRRALNFAALTELNEGMENWLAEGIGLSVGQFLQRIGLDPNAHLEAIGEVGFKGPNQRVVEGADYTALRLLYRKILPTLQSAAASERAAYLAHLRAEGALSADPLVIVDVGWMTSIQHSPYTDDPPSRAGSANRGLLYRHLS